MIYDEFLCHGVSFSCFMAATETRRLKVYSLTGGWTRGIEYNQYLQHLGEKASMTYTKTKQFAVALLVQLLALLKKNLFL